MTYGKQHTRNVSTGEIEHTDMTLEEIAQRDKERAADEIRLSQPEPKSEIETLRETVADLARQLAELKKAK